MTRTKLNYISMLFRSDQFHESDQALPELSNMRFVNVLLPARELEKKGAEIIKLHIGDPNKWDFETPPHVRQALCRAVEINDNGYAESEGYVELRRAILEKEKLKNGINGQIEDCLITNGVTEGIQVVCAATINKGDEMLVPGPGYPTYSELIKFFDGNPVSYKADEANDWQPDIDDMRKKDHEEDQGNSSNKP